MVNVLFVIIFFILFRLAKPSIFDICPQGQLHTGLACIACPNPATYPCVPSALPECTAGSYPTDYSGNCRQCPAGFFCPDVRSATVLLCPEKTYSNAGSQYCSICPSGFECYDRKLHACPADYYSDAGQLKCTKCPPGYECRTSDNGFVGYSMRLKCPPGFYVLGGLCTACPQGSSCPFPELGPLACTSGTYAPAQGMTQCLPCPFGFTCPVGSTTPTPCAAGTYTVPYYQDCINCPANYYCLYGELNECPRYYYSNADSTSCTVCPDGFVCNKQTLAFVQYNYNVGRWKAGACAAGTYASPLDLDCRTCPSGYYCAGGQAIPSLCAGDTYNELDGQTSAAACIACPPGYTSIQGQNYCEICPEGVSCALGIYYPCQSGLFSPVAENTCFGGMAGYTYSTHSSHVEQFMLPCPKGFYCSPDPVSLRVISHPCPVGTYNRNVGAATIASCLACPPGYYCPQGTGDFLPYQCPYGYYCPTSSEIPTPCAAGSYGYYKMLSSQTQCSVCAAGNSCGTSSLIPVLCPSGYFCPNGMGQQPCPGGTYNPFEGVQSPFGCLVCPPGFYCSPPASVPQPYSPGFYSPFRSVGESAAFIKCPAGYPCPSSSQATYIGTPCDKGCYCPYGSSTTCPYKCPAGTYSDSYIARAVTDCLACLEGYYCGIQSTSTDLIRCPAGSYCPLGTATGSIPLCPAGYYRDIVGGIKPEDCYLCQAGYYCLTGSTSATQNDCPIGYYCPHGTSTAIQYPCRAGTYSNTIRIVSQEFCIQCGLGNYCLAASTSVTQCAAGTYNNYNYESSSCTTCPAGYSCIAGTDDPDICLAGTYSASGSSSCSSCPKNYYCPLKGMKDTDLKNYKCPGGFVCVNGVNGIDHHPDLENDYCPVGYYCEGRATDPIACPAGYYNPSRGRKALADCIVTPAGYYTGAGANSYISNPCATGYYCLLGSTKADMYPCPAGTYRRYVGAKSTADCAQCPSGKKCDAGTTNPTACDQGYYCPIGTIIPSPCPPGTYATATGYKVSSSCTACDAGHYCQSYAMTALGPNCDAGYLCISKSITPDPTDGVTGKKCSVGYYCPSGTTSMQYCPAGQTTLVQGAQNTSFCVPCTPGYYCPATVGLSPTIICPSGYYCPAGTSSGTANIANPGFYAPSGSPFQIQCPLGTYQSLSGKSSCDDCGDGNICLAVNLAATSNCPPGYYCPSRATQINSLGIPYQKIACKPGYYNQGTNKFLSSDCNACPAGFACPGPAYSGAPVACSAGFYCKTASPYIAPPIEVGGNYGPCPAGYYCGAQTGSPTPCPIGKYSASLSLQLDTECIICPEGYYCDSLGRTLPTGPCTAGYYCPEGSISPTPTITYCIATQACPAGSASALTCHIGQYQTSIKSSTCDMCISGYFCYRGQLEQCQPGFICP